MTNPYAPPSALPHGSGGTPVDQPPVSPPSAPPSHASTGRRIGLWAGLAVALVVVAAGAAAAGVVVGVRVADDRNAPTAVPAPPTPPTAEQVRASTVDLCTRFVAAAAALPSPQRTGMDVLPVANAIDSALQSNPFADAEIRTAVEKVLELNLEQVSKLSKAPTRGAVHPSTTWDAETANAASDHAWDLCESYAG